jgi:N-methylhydantoinase B
MLKTNVRHPRDFQGDLAAMIGSARVGERRCLALLAEYGADTTRAAIEAILDGAERQTRACITTWKDGVYEGEAILDDDATASVTSTSGRRSSPTEATKWRDASV